MKKYLIICNFYLPNATANGVCVSSIAEQLVKEGNTVEILSLNNSNSSKKQIINGVSVNTIHQGIRNSLISFSDTHKESNYSYLSFKLAMAMNKIFKLLLIPFFPLSSLTLPVRFYFAAKKIILREKIDVLISVNDPLETNVSALFLKKKFAHIKWVFYMLDSISNGAKPSFMSVKQFNDKGLWWEKKLFSKANLILNLNGNRKHYESEVYADYAHKIKFTDIPLLNLDNFTEESVDLVLNPVVSITYAGALTTNLRNPKYACELLSLTSKDIDLKVDFYSRGNCDHIIKSYEKNSSFKLHDYIPHTLLQNKLSNSDILLSIGNRYSEMVPSKTFEYISFGKKILHFYNSETDASLKYFRNYENACVINENDSIDNNIRLIKEFIKSDLKIVSKEFLEIQFKENLPSFTTDLIHNL